jgi:hypothetical protein
MQPQQFNDTQPSSPQPPVSPITPEPPKNNKNMLIVVAAVVVVAILGAIAFTMMNSNKDTSNNSNPSSNNNTSNPVSDKFQKYDVTDKQSGVSFSASFYKDAKVEEKNNRTYLNSGETGSMYSLYLGAATADKIDCGSTPSTTMKLSGESTTVCYASDNSQYAGYAKTKDGAVKINLAGQKTISMEDAKAIMESVSFN